MSSLSRQNKSVFDTVCNGYVKEEYKGKTVVRKQHYQCRPHDYIWYQGTKYIVRGIQDKGKRIALQERLPISVSKIEKFIHANGWAKIY